jgi:predicted nuclease with RNAse H fold
MDEFMDRAVYMGIDPTAGKRPMHVAVLDDQLRMVHLGRHNLESLLASIAEYEPRVVAVDAPQSPNQGLMTRPEVRQRFGLKPSGKTWCNWKLAEFELRRRNIRLYNTPASSDDAPSWMQQGFQIFQRLQALGFQMLTAGMEDGARLLLEVHPHACFTVLLERRPFHKQTLEGRVQRQLVLYLEGLDLPNPMQIFEEITRHHLLQGQLQLENLYDHDSLDALAAAYTAYLCARRPERICQVGDQIEGLITVPVGDLKDRYS